jgi:hypothetical protein
MARNRRQMEKVQTFGVFVAAHSSKEAVRMVPARNDQPGTFQDILELLYGRPGSKEGSRDQTGEHEP